MWRVSCPRRPTIFFGANVNTRSTPIIEPNKTLGEQGWVAFQGGVYDMSEFALEHPGGAELVTEWSGKDGTAALLEAHPGGR